MLYYSVLGVDMKTLLFYSAIFIAGVFLSFMTLVLINYGSGDKFVPFRYMMF